MISLYTIKTTDEKYYDHFRDILVKRFNANCVYSLNKAKNYIEILNRMNMEVKIHEIEITIK